MKLIYRAKQIEELDGISRKDRRVLFRDNHWKVFRHWQGWAGLIAYCTAMYLIIFSGNLTPEGTSWWYGLLLVSPLVLVLCLIYSICYYSTIAPYIRREIEFWRRKGFL